MKILFLVNLTKDSNNYVKVNEDLHFVDIRPHPSVECKVTIVQEYPEGI